MKKITRKERQNLGYYSCANWVKPFINSYLKETDGGNFALIDKILLNHYYLLQFIYYKYCVVFGMVV